jgi:hypothetical protein
MKTDCRRISILAMCLLMSLAIAVAGPKGNGKGKGEEKHAHGNGKAAVVKAPVAVNIFVQNDRDLIRHHFRTNRKNLPPGLAKRGGDLPPGLEKQLIRNGHLPPGLEKKIYLFPVEVERRLPPLRPGLIRGVIGASAVILDSKTKVILDVFAVF